MLTTWARLDTWQHHAVCFDPNERGLLVATSIGIQIHALPERDMALLLPCEGEPMALAFRPDGRAFASLERGAQPNHMLVCVYDATNRCVLPSWRVDLPGDHNTLQSGQQGNRLLVSSLAAHV